MAPEVYAEEYNELVDIYAFGMCVLELVYIYSSYLGYEPRNDLDYMPDFNSYESDTLINREDENFENLGITIKGRKEDDGIFLKLRMADKKGRIRNINFPFDIEVADTALSVAAEMVSELDITDQKVTKIAEMIDGEIVALVPEWNKNFDQEESWENASRDYCQGCAHNSIS